MKSYINLFFKDTKTSLARLFVINNSKTEKYYALGIFILISYPIYSLIFQYSYNNSNILQVMNIVAVWLGIFLILHKYWPDRLKVLSQLYWYITIFFCIPFYFTFTALLTQLSSFWLMNTVTGLFILALIVEWIPLVILLVLGVVTAIVTFYFYYGYIVIAPLKLEPFIYYIPVILAGLLFSNKRRELKMAKLDMAKSLSSNIAHDLRTPLASIRLAAQATSHFMPALFQAYKLAKEADLPIQKIQKQRLKLAESAMNRIINDITSANDIISSLEMNLNSENINQNKFSVFSIKQLLDNALESFPYRSDILKEKIKKLYSNQDDFKILGSEQLTRYIIYNLLKNALYHIESKGQGELSISIQTNKPYNELHFKDTASSIPDNIRPYIFEHFFSDRTTALGMGLAYCKNVMRAYGGDIVYHKNVDDTNEFILYFPVISKT